MNITITTEQPPALKLAQPDGLGRAVFSDGNGNWRVVTTRDTFSFRLTSPEVVRVGDIDNDPAALLVMMLGKAQAELKEFRQRRADALETAERRANIAEQEAKTRALQIMQLKLKLTTIARDLAPGVTRSTRLRAKLLERLQELAK